MSVLTEEQREKLRGQLLDRQAALKRRSESSSEDARPVSLDQPIGRLTRMDAMQQQQMALGQQKRIERELQQIEAALVRLERNQYGFCLRCQEPIPYGRLEIRPTATLCYDCQCELDVRTNQR